MNPESTPASRFLQIGSRRELFLDDLLTERFQGLDFRLHQPVSAGPAITFEQPWEGNSSIYHTVLHDGDRYLLYYRGADLTYPPYQPDIRPDEPKIQKSGPDDSWENACVAISKDGIHWEKPELGLVEFKGSKKNNIILGGEEIHHCFAPMIDPRPECPPEEKFKAFDRKRAVVKDESAGLQVYTSPDGIHWTLKTPEPVIQDGKFDSLNIPFYDTERGYFLAYYRDFFQGIRGIKVARSDDFLNWTPGQWLRYGSHLEEQLYTNAVTPYCRAPHYYLGFPKRFISHRNPLRFEQQDKPHRKGLSDSLLMASRDGVNFKRWREAFIRPGLDPRNWSDRCNSVSCGVVSTSPTELSMYVNRNYTYPTNYLDRMVLRADGFVSLHAGGNTGEWVSKPFLMNGSDLELNFSTSVGGSVRFEILDEHGFPYPRFSLEETPLIYGDAVDLAVYHEYHPEMCSPRDNAGPLRHLIGRPVRLRLLLRDADVYSYRFRDDFEAPAS